MLGSGVPKHGGGRDEGESKKGGREGGMVLVMVVNA